MVRKSYKMTKVYITTIFKGNDLSRLQVEKEVRGLSLVKY